MNPFRKDKIILPVERKETSFYYSIKCVTVPSDNWPAYQIEYIKIKDGKIVDRGWLDKRDTIDMVLPKMHDLIDPRLTKEDDIPYENTPIG